MTDRSRRALLRDAVGLACLGTAAGTGGCLGFFESEDLGRLASVPPGAEFVAHADVEAMLADESVREGADEELARETVLLGGADSVTDLFEEFQTETGLDIRDVSELLTFGEFETDENEEEFLATLVWSDWNEGSVRDALAGVTDVTTDSHGGRTVYASDEVWVAVLGEGAFAVGAPQAVRDVVDLRESEDGTPVAGETREAYLAAPEGYLRYGFEVSAETISSIPAEAVNQSLLEDIAHGHGAVYSDGDERVAALLVQATGTAEAEDVESILRGAVALGQEQDRETSDQPVGTLLLEAVDGITVSRNGDVVRVAYRTDAATAGSALIRVAGILEEYVVTL